MAGGSQPRFLNSRLPTHMLQTTTAHLHQSKYRRHRRRRVRGKALGPAGGQRRAGWEAVCGVGGLQRLHMRVRCHNGGGAPVGASSACAARLPFFPTQTEAQEGKSREQKWHRQPRKGKMGERSGTGRPPVLALLPPSPPAGKPLADGRTNAASPPVMRRHAQPIHGALPHGGVPVRAPLQQQRQHLRGRRREGRVAVNGGVPLESGPGAAAAFAADIHSPREAAWQVPVPAPRTCAPPGGTTGGTSSIRQMPMRRSSAVQWKEGAVQ